MGKDYPDWGTYSGEFKESPVRDLGELAVRLGSPLLFTKSGQVLMIEDFSLGLGRWQLFAAGSGILPVLRSDNWLTGGFCCRLNPGGVAGGQSRITKGISGYPDSPLGVQIAFSVSSFCRILLYVEQWCGGVIKNYYVRLTFNAVSKIEVVGDDLAYHTVLDNISLHAGRTLFHYLKFVWYPAAGRYAWLQLDNVIVPVIDWLPVPGIAANQWQFFAYIQAESDGIPNCDVQIDHIVFTYNEPL